MANTKKITKVIPDAIAENVFKFFYESIEPYRNKFEYSDTRIIDGKKVTYDHVVFERKLYPPKKNRFELYGVEWKAKIKKGKPRITIPTVNSFDALQMPDSVFVVIRYSHFFEDIVQGLLSHFDSKPKDKKKKAEDWIPSLVVMNNEERIRKFMSKNLQDEAAAQQYGTGKRNWQRYISEIKKLDELREKAT